MCKQTTEKCKQSPEKRKQSTEKRKQSAEKRKQNRDFCLQRFVNKKKFVYTNVTRFVYTETRMVKRFIAFCKQCKQKIPIKYKNRRFRQFRQKRVRLIRLICAMRARVRVRTRYKIIIY